MIIQTLNITGITCEACVRLIKNKFSRTPGVIEVVSAESSGVVRVKVSNLLPREAYETALKGTPYTINKLA